MKKTGIRLFLVGICAGFLLVLLTAIGTAAAGEDFSYSVSDGHATLSRYKGKDTEVVVPDTLGGAPVTEIGESAFINNATITRVTLPDSVTKISGNAFANCSALTTVELSDNVTSIGGSAFAECWELRGFALPASLESLSYYTFGNCRSLDRLDFPATLTDAGSIAFSGCTGITEITVSPDNPVYYEDGQCIIIKKTKEILLGCKNSVIPNDGSVVSIAKRAFYGCLEGEELTVPEGIVSIGEYAFAHNKALRRVHLPASLASMEDGVFCACTEVRELTVSPENSVFHTAGNALIRTKTKELIAGFANTVIPTDGSVTVIGKYAFLDIGNLEHLDIPGSITEIGHAAFENCVLLSNVTLPAGLTKISNYAFKSCEGFTYVSVPENVTYIGEGAFYGCNHLVALEMGDKVTTLGTKAFYQCTALRHVHLSGGLKEVPMFTFDGCSSLETIAFPPSVTTIGSYVFRDCKALSAVTIPTSVKSLAASSSLFIGCTGIKSIYIPATVTSISKSIFSDCGKVNVYGETGSAAESFCKTAKLNFCGTCTEHIPTAFETLSATCTTPGLTGGKYCSVCSAVLEERSIVPILPHEEETDLPVPPTCENTGLTAGSHCALCHVILVPQEEIPALDHDLIPHEGKAPSCTEIGWDAYDTCSRCDYTTYKERPVLDHDLIPHEGKAPSCTEIGWDAYDTCSRCDYTTYKELPALDHDMIHHEAKAPSCTEVGWDAYDTCSRCDYTTYKELPITAHEYKAGACIRCGAKDPDYVPTNPFSDVKKKDWFYENVMFAYASGLFSGKTETTFAPNDPMTRGMLVTVLWRLDGQPEAKGANPFSDVKAKQYYAEPIKWAAENNIVGGVGGDRFDPEGNVTREQIAKIMYGYAALKQYDTAKTADITAFPDYGKVSKWAREFLSWANAEGLIGGTNRGGVAYLDPQGNATRAQVAAIMQRFAQAHEN